MSSKESSMILLSDWISHTIDEVDRKSKSLDTVSAQDSNLRKYLILCSDDYLLPALRVSLALADSICKAEEDGDCDALLPVQSCNWSDAIAIYCEQSSSQQSNGDGALNIENGGAGDRIEITYLPSSYNANDTNLSFVNPKQHIYSLGLVFYEIFSGGERPVLQHSTAADGSNDNELSRQDNDINYDPLPFDPAASFELNLELSEIDHLLDELNPDEDRSSMPKRRQTQQQSNSVSLAPLKSKWIPGPLCDLIANMLDCTNGTLAGEDSYEAITDVRDDLQLMLEKPGIFLYDQDMSKLSVTGLQLRDTMFGRNEELSTMKEAYRRSMNGEGELMILSGPSGSGKSLLAHEFGKFVTAGGGIVLSGKFDQLQQGKPFSALASAFDTYCGNLLKDNCPSKIVPELASKLVSTLGGEAHYLTKMIPNLALILGPDVFNITRYDQVCDHPQERLQYLLCQFVEVISSTSGAPVTLFLDDLQWADSASIAAVSQLLFTTDISSSSTRKHKQFFFFGCCREGGINKDHPVWKVFCQARLVGVKYTNVKLEYFGEDALNAMVSEILHISPRLTRRLSRTIYHKTKGNALFVSQLMLSLRKDGLLRPSLSRRRWEWDLGKIQGQTLPEDVAIFITNSIEALSADVKFCICVLSCFGASAEISVIKKLEEAMEREVVENLDKAVKEGLLDKVDNHFCFSHDRIQEAAYSMMPTLDRCNFHFFYGMALAPLERGDTDDSNLLIAANQINLAGPEAVKNDSQYALVANLNLKAGKKAMEMSDFVAAYSYFDNGITFLRKNHWKEHYTLSLELFELAAKCALTSGDTTSLKLLYEQVLAYGKTFQDKLNIMYYYTCALAFSSQLPESIEMGLDILSQLGIELRVLGSSVEACVQETRTFLSNYSDDDILRSRRMTDLTMKIAMKFLGKLEGGMTQLMPQSVVHVTQRIIQLSLLHGISPVSPIGFVHFGSQMAKLGDIKGGYHYVKLALKLLDKVGSRESAGEVIFFSTHVRGYVEPLQAALEYFDEGYVAGMAYGDVFTAAFNRSTAYGLFLSTGRNLQSLRETFDDDINLAYERKQQIVVMNFLQVQHSLLKLMGTDEEPKNILEGRDIIATNNSVMTTVYYQKSYISFMFRSYDDTKDFVEKYLDCIGNTWANLFLNHAFHAFYVGLISFWFARKSNDGRQWLEKGKLFKMAMKKWSDTSVWTFENKWLLMEAEESFCNNDFDAAKSYYERAISSAKAHKFINEEALACELGAYFYQECGQKEKSLGLFLQAHEKYNEWGAFGKCNSLFQFVTSNFTLPAGYGLGN